MTTEPTTAYAWSGTPLSRRSALRALGAGALTLIGGGALAACGGSSTTSVSSVTPAGSAGATGAASAAGSAPAATETAKVSIQLAYLKNVQFAGLIFQTVWGLITRETSPKQLMGPVAIAQLSGESAQLGWVALLSLMASLSLNLGLLNLLPIPVLDGGHIFIMGLEGLARRDFSLKVKEKLLLGGFVVLMVLMATVIYNDLTRISWIGRLMPWK